MTVWSDLDGWFNYEHLYSAMAQKYQGGVFVEVGSWLGRSVCYLATECQKYPNESKIYAVDTWDGLDPDYMEKAKKIHNKETVYEIFTDNIKNCGFEKIITPIVSLSWDGAKLFEDQSCDFIFIDADHQYDSVVKDIEAWLPKLKPTGTLAGHDIFAEQVRAAVTDGLNKFGRTFVSDGICWIMS